MILHVWSQKRLPSYDDFSLSPQSYGWETRGSVLYIQYFPLFMPKDYTTIFGCQKCCSGKSIKEGTCNKFFACSVL